MNKSILLMALLFSGFLYAIPGGKGAGGKAIEIRTTAGYVPYARFKVKGRDYNFYYTGYRWDTTLSYYTAPFIHGGLYFVKMRLKNKENTEADKETMDIWGLGLSGTGVAPNVLRPFFELGLGYYICRIRRAGTVELEHLYKQGTAVKLALGLGPRIRGIGLFMKIEGEYVMYEKGENTNNESERLFNMHQFSYSANVGLQIAL